MENKFITLNVIGDNQRSGFNGPVTINKDYIIKFAPDGEDNTRVHLSKHTVLVSDDYRTVYQQVTGKVFLG